MYLSPDSGMGVEITGLGPQVNVVGTSVDRSC